MENNVRGTSPLTSGSNNADGALHKASSSVHDAVNSVAGAANQAARKAKPAIDHVAAIAHQAVDKVAGVAAPTADWLAEQGENLNATQKKLVSDTCDYVSAHPLKSVGIALVTGFILSRFLR